MYLGCTIAIFIALIMRTAGVLVVNPFIQKEISEDELLKSKTFHFGMVTFFLGRGLFYVSVGLLLATLVKDYIL